MKKIMFNDRYGLTEAVLQGRKTVTRRVIEDSRWKGGFIKQSPFVQSGFEDAHGYELIPRFQIGEVVAVAQPYKDVCDIPKGYKAGKSDTEETQEAIRAVQCRARTNLVAWHNKMFVRADLMPHQIRIAGIRIERLQDISDEDCLREGIYYGNRSSRNPFEGFTFIEAGHYDTPREAFAALIDKVSGKGTWEANPWVFVYDFELVK